MDYIEIKGARQHNLKNINLCLPRKSLVVVTGLSGSGKSSLVFDTIYQESRRRFLETLPTYVLRFMERIARPDADRINGLSPAVAVEQRNPVNSARSTVGTITEIYDYLRLLFARCAVTICPGCGGQVGPDTAGSAAAELLAHHESRRAIIAFTPLRSAKVDAATLRLNLLAMGFIRALLPGSGQTFRLDESAGEPLLGPDRDFRVVVDRLRIEKTTTTRLVEALATALAHGEGSCAVYLETENGFVEKKFSQQFHCADCDTSFPEPTPNLFSFNSSYGACPRCRGFGDLLEYDPELIVPDSGRTVAGGALDPWTKPRYTARREQLKAFCRQEGIAFNTPWRELPEPDRDKLLHGHMGFEGVFPFLRALERKKYKQYIRFFLRGYQSERTCPECGGGRLRREAANVLLSGRTVDELTAMSVEALRSFCASADALRAKGAARELLAEVSARLDFMLEVGLGYLTLSRLTRTLSGGEYQRIMLTRLLGSGLTETLFVLDEPTIGLHQRDTARLVGILRKLVDSGNSLLVVEHDTSVIQAADHVVELGPGSGEHGGRVLFSGPAPEFAGQDTATARSLVSAVLPVSTEIKRKPGKKLSIRGATLHNLTGERADFALGAFNCVTGVSGSGKSSLVTGVLVPSLERLLRGEPPAGQGMTGVQLTGAQQIGGVVLVDQTPIGRTPRSNPITYIKAFDHIRKLFAATSAAARLGLSAGSFSFNTAGGRCERCKGAGFETVDMQFMADVMVPCEQCDGRRFAGHALAVRYKGLNIHEVLALTVNEAMGFFKDHSALGKQLWLLQSVGLGYLCLGQSATTLSGGESQRLKIAREIGHGSRGKVRRGKLFVLDEPTTGLHYQEVLRLLKVLERLLEAGHTVLVVEHHPAVIARADWIVDLGPEGGEGGGGIVVQGPPGQIAACPASHTGAMLAGMLSETKPESRGGAL